MAECLFRIEAENGHVPIAYTFTLDGLDADFATYAHPSGSRLTIDRQHFDLEGKPLRVTTILAGAPLLRDASDLHGPSDG